MKRFRRFIQDIYAYDVHGLASELSFTFLLTVFPLLVVFVTLLGLIQDSKTINLVTSQVGKFLPAPIFLPIDQSVKNLTRIKSYNVIAVSIIISFFSSLTIFGTMSKALRFISRDETKVGFLASQWINFRLLFISSLLLVVYFYFTYGLVLSERFLFRTFKFGFFRSYSVFFIGLVAFVLITSLFVYYYANITRFRTQLRDNLPGAFLASFFVTLISFGFNFYLKLKNVGVNYSFAYELLSKMVVLMLYTYINSTFFIWGFVWNQIMLEEKNKKKGIKS